MADLPGRALHLFVHVNGQAGTAQARRSAPRKSACRAVGASSNRYLSQQVLYEYISRARPHMTLVAHPVSRQQQRARCCARINLREPSLANSCLRRHRTTEARQPKQLLPRSPVSQLLQRALHPRAPTHAAPRHHCVCQLSAATRSSTTHLRQNASQRRVLPAAAAASSSSPPPRPPTVHRHRHTTSNGVRGRHGHARERTPSTETTVVGDVGGRDRVTHTVSAVAAGRRRRRRGSAYQDVVAPADGAEVAANQCKAPA